MPQKMKLHCWRIFLTLFQCAKSTEELLLKLPIQIHFINNSPFTAPGKNVNNHFHHNTQPKTNDTVIRLIISTTGIYSTCEHTQHTCSMKNAMHKTGVSFPSIILQVMDVPRKTENGIIIVPPLLPPQKIFKQLCIMKHSQHNHCQIHQLKI